MVSWTYEHVELWNRGLREDMWTYNFISNAKYGLMGEHQGLWTYEHKVMDQ